MNLVSGQLVRVYPSGHRGRTAIGTVQIISRNQGMIAVSFADKPPFVIGDGRVIHPTDGIILYAMRVAFEGKPTGPWIELNGGAEQPETAQPREQAAPVLGSLGGVSWGGNGLGNHCHLGCSP